MHRIDSADATPDHLFTEGDPTVPVDATTVTAPWLTDVQENLCQAIEAAGIALAKGDGTQLAQAILALIAANAPTPELATEEAAGLSRRATVAEAVAGEAAEPHVTPEGLAAALAANPGGVSMYAAYTISMIGR